MKTIYIFLFITIPFYGFSQQLFDSNSRITIQGGIDPATMVTLRYERHLRNTFLNRDIYPYAEFSSTLTRFGVKNSELKLGQRMPIWNYRSIQFISGLNTSFANAETINFDSKRFALEGDIALGYFWKKSFLALTTSYEKILITEINHSQYYRDRFYSDAKSGWYKGGGGTFQFGLEGGVCIKNRVDIYMELKIPFTEQFNALMGSPGHLNVGVGYRW